MSRELIRIQAPFRQPEWSAASLIEAPDSVHQIHLEFASAGADVITTNSYALVPFHIGEERFWKQGRELAEKAGKLARKAADEASTNGRKVLVAGSLPPIFGSYEPQKFQPERVLDYLKILVEGLSPYVDVWLGETLSLIAEAEAVKKVTASTERPLWISFCPDDSSPSASLDNPSLRSGESVADVTSWAVDATGVDALLFNCSRPEFITSGIETASHVAKQKHSSIRLGAYANAFLPRSNEYAANENVAAVDEALGRERYVEEAKLWVEHGASILGGCCGIGVSHIEHLAKTYKSPS